MSESEEVPMTEVVVFLDPRMEETIEGQLEYGDSKSQWIREACEMRLNEELADKRIEPEN